jgi:hypothetical protein
MSSIHRPGAVLLVALGWMANTSRAQTPPERIFFQINYATVQRQAQATGLPVMAIVLAKGSKLPAPLNETRVARQSRPFLNVVLSENEARTKKIAGATPGGIVFLDGEGKVLTQVAPGFDVDQLLAEMAGVLRQARERVLKKLMQAKATATVQKTAFDSYLRLGAGIPDLIPLLKHPNAAVKLAVQTNLAARAPEGADWALLKEMASPDAAVRAACYPLALALAKAPRVPPAKFWKEASEEERATALAKWRQTVFGKMPPVNEAILEFAFAHLGQQVEDGECASLAVAALKAARGQPIQYEGKTYRWGKALPAGATAVGGDIVQLEGAHFSNGNSAGHHTQIIRCPLGPGRYQILHQNFNGRRFVVNDQLDLNLLTRGSVVIYRPQPIGDVAK